MTGRGGSTAPDVTSGGKRGQARRAWLGGLLRPHAGGILVAAVISIVVAAAALSQPFLARQVIDAVQVGRAHPCPAPPCWSAC